MRYDRVAVAVRERRPIEAVDLGFAFAKRHYASLVLASCLGVIPVAIACYLVLARYHVAWALAALAWMKPLFERLPLIVASRLLFGDTAGLARQWYRREFWRSLPGDLSLRRPSPWRSYATPVRVLERLRGSQQRKRLWQVTSGGRAIAGVVAALVFVCELIVWYGIMVFVYSIFNLNEFLYAAIAPFEGPDVISSVWRFVAYVAAVTLATPFSVCVGFCLYINRRVLIEGWDIELRFKKLASRLSASASRSASALTVVAAISVWLVATPLGAQDAAVPEPADFRAAIDTVIEHPDFGSEGTQSSWRLRNRDRQRQRSVEDLDADFEAPTRLIGWLADAAPWLFGATVAFAVGLVLVKGRGRLRGRSGDPVRSEAQAKAETGGQAEPRLPDDWIAAAGSAWDAGNLREALSLLYRGSVHLVEAVCGRTIPVSSTEGEFERFAQAQLEPSDTAMLDFVHQTVRSWRSFAYAGSRPVDEAFEQMCRHARTLTTRRAEAGGQ